MDERGWGRGRGGAHAEPPAAIDAVAWIDKSLPADWFIEPADIVIDRDEIVIVGMLPAPRLSDSVSEEERALAERDSIAEFRERSRERRVRLGAQLEHRYRRKVAWGATAGDMRQMFSTYSAPVMTRLRQPERQILDTLVDAGVVRSRSEALAWCVRLVGDQGEQWLNELRVAMGTVEQLRRRGPYPGDSSDSGEVAEADFGDAAERDDDSDVDEETERAGAAGRVDHADLDNPAGPSKPRKL